MQISLKLFVYNVIVEDNNGTNIFVQAHCKSNVDLSTRKKSTFWNSNANTHGNIFLNMDMY